MRSVSRPVFTVFLSCIALLALPGTLFAQQQTSNIELTSAADLPAAPNPQSTQAADSSQNPQTPAQTPAAQNSSSSQAAAPQTDAEKSAREKAEEQLKQQEQQRVMGVMATFNTTSNKDALPLSSGQKFRLFFKSSTDPWPFLLAGVVSGIGQADDSYPEWGQGAQGYAKRYGAAYSDAFIGNFFGNALLPGSSRSAHGAAPRRHGCAADRQACAGHNPADG
jgi:hypothetical protein